MNLFPLPVLIWILAHEHRMTLVIASLTLRDLRTCLTCDNKRANDSGPLSGKGGDDALPARLRVGEWTT